MERLYLFGTIGFSYVGLLYLLMLTLPNLIWTKHKPIDYDSSNESKVLLGLERIGQVLCTASVLLFRDFNIRAYSPWSLWLIASFVLMLLYELCWIRYFLGAHTNINFYRSFFRIPVPLASLPVMAFLLLGIYGRVIWLILSAVLIGIGHVGIHLAHFNEARASKNSN